MESFWGGAFSLPVEKHRDFEHAHDVAAHLRAAGIVPRVDRKVRVEKNPIDSEKYETNRTFYVVKVEIKGQNYDYLVPAASDGGPPTESQIDKWINSYAKNKVPGGRRIEDYIIAEDLI